jgi:hypothetical protein
MTMLKIIEEIVDGTATAVQQLVAAGCIPAADITPVSNNLSDADVSAKLRGSIVKVSIPLWGGVRGGDLNNEI